MNDNYHNAMNAPIQRNSDGSDSGVELYESPWDMIVDMLKTVVFVVCSVALGIVLAIALAWFTGLGAWLFT